LSISKVLSTEAGDFIKVFKVWNFEAPSAKERPE